MSATPWRRDARPAEICSCGCSFEGHRIDLKVPECNTCSDCPEFALAALRWYEHRTVTEPVDGAA